MVLVDIIRKRPYIIFTIITIILSLINYNKDIGKLSDLSIELLKGLPIVIILIETQKKNILKCVDIFV